MLRWRSASTGLLQEVTLDECISAHPVQLIQPRVCLGKHVLKLVRVLEDFRLDHAIRLYVINLALVLLVVFGLKRQGRFTHLRRLHFTKVGLFCQELPLALVEVKLPARVVDEGTIHIEFGIIILLERTLVAHELD